MKRCVALLSGGLDSMLAIRIMQEQGIEVEALHFKTVFTCCQDQAGQAARELDVRLTIVTQDDDYLDLVKYPRFGYGKGANPCIDCRIYMFERARQFMQRVDAQFVVSGEVLGQRPKSQKRRDLELISFHSRLEELLLRPLCAKLLPITLPEREGWVKRNALYAVRGRSRKELIELAGKYKLRTIPTPSTGCALTETRFSEKVHDLINLHPDSQRWDFELLKLGRHFRFDANTKVIVGRRESENESLKYMYHLPESRAAAMLSPHNFKGPRAIVVGPSDDSALNFALGLVLRYSKQYSPDNAVVCIEQAGIERQVCAAADDRAAMAQSLGSGE